MDVRPFTIRVPETTLADLRQRLMHTHWPDELHDVGWDYGSNMAYIKELVEYWYTRFDWRAQERALNALPHFRAQVDGLGIHFIHVQRWTEMPRGGHFAALEEPDLLAEDIRAFFRSLR